MDDESDDGIQQRKQKKEEHYPPLIAQKKPSPNAFVPYFDIRNIQFFQRSILWGKLRRVSHWLPRLIPFQNPLLACPPDKVFLPGVGFGGGAAGAREDSVQPLYCVRRKRNFEGMHGSVQLLERTRADNNGRHCLLTQQPAKRDIGGKFTDIPAQCFIG